MKRPLLAFLCVFILVSCAACGGSSGSSSQGLVIQVSGSFASVRAGGAAQDLSVTISGGSGGVIWTLSVAGAGCSPGCGTLKVASAPSLSAVYTPPATPPLNQEATITVRSVADDKQVFVFNFQIIPAVAVSVAPKFTSVNVGGAAQNLTATVTNDSTNSGVTWALTAGGANCQPGCGTLTVAAAPSFTAQYQPPVTPPTTANASPTIMVTSVADTTKTDSFSFTIVTPPIAVAIGNKFSSTFTGGQAIGIGASLTDDFANQGLSWALTNAGAACTAACGTLVAVGNPSMSAIYTPPPSPAMGPTPSPTITATSVSDPTKSDSFTFSLVIPNSLVAGNYIFLLRGYDQALQPMALAGVLTADGLGNITGGEYDLNDNTTVTTVAGPLTGSYSTDVSFSGIPRVTFNITGPGASRSFSCAFSADGKRAKLIELDSTLALNAGSLLQQDATAVTALAATTTSTSFAFGLDSDAPLNARVVEAGQFSLGPGAASVTGGVADEGQAGAANPIFGGLTGAAPIAAGSSAATAPDASGRGTLTLSIGGGSTQYAYYVVNSAQLDLLEIDAGGALVTVQAGTAMSQSGLSATSNQAISVAALTGMTSVAGAPSPNVIIGVLSNPTGTAPTAYFDNNNAGAVSLSQNAAGTLPVPFDATTGRAVIAGAFFPDAVAYYYSTGTAFVADVTPSNNGANQGFSGQLFLQSTTGAGGFTAQSLSGNSIAMAGATATSSMTNLDLAVNFDGAGNDMAAFDFTLSNLAIGSSGQGQNLLLNGATYRVDDTHLGRGELLQIPSGFFNNFPSQSDQMSFYLIGTNQFVAIEELGLSPCGIMFFDPQ